MKSNTQNVQKKYNKYATFYDLVEWPIEKFVFRKWRSKLFSQIRGNTLEVGVGTGNNIEFYSKSANVTAIDLSPNMLDKARTKAKFHNGKTVELLEADVHNLSNFKAQSFTYVVCTFVLCSVADPVQALREMKRVLKKDGKLIMVEHVLSKNKLVALWQHIHNPITRLLFGFNVNRDTKNNIEKSGLYIINDEKLGFFDIFRKFTCEK